MCHSFSPKTALLVASLITAAMTAHAAPITTLFNTGVDAAGTPLGNDASDIHYTLINVPSGTTGLRVATSANGFPIPPWLGDDAMSAWIGPNSDNALDGPSGSYDYRTTFNLAGLMAPSASIVGQWSTDDNGTDILLNGVLTGNTAADYTSFDGFTLSSGFVSGVNTLDFIVTNMSGPTGLRVEMTGSASPESTSVPEPASLAVLGAGLLGLGLSRRKRS